MSNEYPYVNFRFSKKSREIYAYAWMEHAHKYIFWLNYTHSLQGTIQVLRQQRGGWVESENGNFC